MSKKLVTDSPAGLITIQTVNAGTVECSAVPDSSGESDVANTATNAAGLGPALSIYFETAAITPVRTGKFLVWATGSGDAAGLTSEQFRLWADGSGVTKIASGKTSTASQSSFTCCIHGYVELDPDVTHTFRLECEVTYGGQNISCNAHEFMITWLELG